MLLLLLLLSPECALGAVKPPKATALELPFRASADFIDPFSDTHPRNIAAEASRLALLQKHGPVKKKIEESNRPKKMLGND